MPKKEVIEMRENLVKEAVKNYRESIKQMPENFSGDK